MSCAQAKPPRKRLELVRKLMPTNPHLAYSKDGFPVSLTALGGADLAAISRDLTPEDAVRGAWAPQRARGIPHGAA